MKIVETIKIVAELVYPAAIGLAMGFVFAWLLWFREYQIGQSSPVRMNILIIAIRKW